MARPAVMWTVSQAAEWAETRNEPAVAIEPVPRSEFGPIEIRDLRQTLEMLAWEGVHPTLCGMLRRSDVILVFPPRNRGRPRGEGYFVEERPGRVQALARFLLENEPVGRRKVAEHYRQAICRLPDVAFPEKSKGFSDIYRSALTEAEWAAGLFDEMDGGADWSEHISAWKAYRYRTK